jgi:hypothetical protein
MQQQVPNMIPDFQGQVQKSAHRTSSTIRSPEQNASPERSGIRTGGVGSGLAELKTWLDAGRSVTTPRAQRIRCNRSMVIQSPCDVRKARGWGFEKPPAEHGVKRVAGLCAHGRVGKWVLEPNT